MPFVKVDPIQEQREFEEFLKDPEAKKAYEEFEREYAFRQKLSEIRKANSITQQEDTITWNKVRTNGSG